MGKKNIIPSDDEVLEFNLKTAQDLNLFKIGFIKYELPKHLQHKTLSDYHLDDVLLIRVKKIRDTFYIKKESLSDIGFILNDKNCAMLGVTPEPIENFISYDLVAMDIKNATQKQKRVGD